MDCTICGLQLNVTEVRSHQQIWRKDEADVEMTASERSQVEMSEFSEVISFFFSLGTIHDIRKSEKFFLIIGYYYFFKGTGGGALVGVLG